MRIVNKLVLSGVAVLIASVGVFAVNKMNTPVVDAPVIQEPVDKPAPQDEPKQSTKETEEKTVTIGNAEPVEYIPPEEEEVQEVEEKVIRSVHQIAKEDYPHMIKTPEDNKCLDVLVEMLPHRFTEDVREYNMKSLSLYYSYCAAYRHDMVKSDRFFDSENAKIPHNR